MKYRGLSPEDAWDLSLARGKLMYLVDYWGGLQQQVLGLYDYIHGLPCDQGNYCVQKTDPQPRPAYQPRGVGGFCAANWPRLLSMPNNKIMPATRNRRVENRAMRWLPPLSKFTSP